MDFAVNSLRTLIAANESWLVDRVLVYAKQHGYTRFSSTLKAPWRESICGFSEPLLEVLATSNLPMEMPATTDYVHESIAAFAVEEAQLHRERGIPLGLFMGLTKYYRQAYLDLIIEQGYDRRELESYRLQIERFFDHIEIAFCTEWSAATETDLVKEAHAHNRTLTNEKNKYLTIFESLNDPVILVDDHGRIENLNNAAAALFGASAIPGEGYYGQREYDMLARQLDGLVKNRAPADRFELTLDTMQGVREFEVKVQRMLDVSEKFIGTVVILSDITDHKHAKQEADAASRAKSTFLATMSHEVRTPITGILGISRLLMDGPLSDEQSDYVSALVSSGEVLLAIVNDVLDYSKIEAEAIEVDSNAFDLRDMVDQVANLVAASAEQKGLTLSVEMDAALPRRVVGDEAKVRRVLLNLATNAVKFTPAGSVTISASRASLALRFAVEDTGIGIAEGAKRSLFMPFTQQVVDGGADSGGTGLGLAISKKLVEAMGGDIGYDTEPGVGSRFWFDIALQEAAPAAPAELEIADASDVANLRVLLVEDNEVNKLVTEGFLLRDGHQVQAVASGEAAVEALTSAGADLVLMDIRMDGMGGLEAIRRIRSLADRRTASVPLLVLTADLATTQEKTCLKTGADLVLGKPFDPSALRQAVAKCLTKARERTLVDTGVGLRAEILLDEAVIRQHQEILGSARTRLIVDTFHASAPSTMEAIRKAAERGDASRVSDLAHSLQSAAGNVGLLRLSQAAQTLEEAARDTAPAEWIRDVDRLSSAFDHSIAALKQSGIIHQLEA